MIRCHSISEKFDYLGLFENVELDQCNLAIVDEWTTAIDLSHVPNVLFFSTEALPYSRDWEAEIASISEKFSIGKDQLIVVCGGHELDYNNQQTACPVKIFCFNYFFNEVVRNNNLIGLNFSHDTPREKLFDCLLGGRKPHRIFIYNRLIESGYLTKSLVNLNKGSPWEKNYFGGYEHLQRVLEGPGFTDVDNLPVYSSPELQQWENKSVLAFKGQHLNDFYSAEIIRSETNEFGYHPQVSALLPTEIYNNSHYSIVAETGAEFNYFLSEKVAKPMFAKRIFVMFGSKGTLRYLNELGFKTFSSIIDESYDNEEDNFKRYTMAWEQCEFLAKQDPALIYNKVGAVLKHNQRHLLNWPKQLDKLKNFIVNACVV